MNIEIIIFGQLKDIIGSDTIKLGDIADTNELQKKLQLKYPALSNAKYVIAVDKKLIHGNIPVNEKCEIALLPPFSGG